MLFNYDPFADIEELEDLYYKAALAGFENLEDIPQGDYVFSLKKCLWWKNEN